MPRAGLLFVLVGPSGAGKNTLMKRVQPQFDDLTQLATMTTRAKRASERNGREHWFVSHDEFQNLIDTDALIEWQRVHLSDLYGTPRQTVETAIQEDCDLIADIEFLGASKVHATYPDNTVLIFVTPSSLDILAERIRERGNITPEAFQDRIERAKFELTFAPQCDYLVLNDDLETATHTLYQIIVSERMHRRSPHAGSPPIPTRHTFHTTITALIQRNGYLLTRANQLPAFQSMDRHQPPHETLRKALDQALDYDVTIGALSDDRFDFVAPNHVTIACNPPDVRLYFYYECALEPPAPASIPGWSWQPRVHFDLPTFV